MPQCVVLCYICFVEMCLEFKLALFVAVECKVNVYIGIVDWGI